jgi:hypothetical protein
MHGQALLRRQQRHLGRVHRELEQFQQRALEGEALCQLVRQLLLRNPHRAWPNQLGAGEQQQGQQQ